jgi:hypothetical protein
MKGIIPWFLIESWANIIKYDKIMQIKYDKIMQIKLEYIFHRLITIFHSYLSITLGF